MPVKRLIGRLPADTQPAAIRIVVSYTLLGGAWIIFSDRLLSLLVDDPASLTRLQTYKGWLFVILTASLLFLLINRSLQKLRRSEELALARLAEQERAETALAERELQYHSTMDASLAGVFVHQDLHFRYVNPTMAKLHGYSPDELTGQLGPTDLVILEQRDWVAQNIARRELGESTRPFELQALRKDGSIFAALVWGKAISYEGRPASVGTLIDISEQRWAEGALRSAIDRLEDEKAKSEAIIEALGDGISIQDTEFRIIYQNQVIRKWLGDRAGEFCYQAYEGRDQICAGCPLEQSFADGRIHGAERLARPGCGVESVEITTSALRDAAGKIIAGIEVVRDIADRKRTEAALLDHQEQLKSLAAELSIAEEKERRRIASELHDQIGQTLALTKIKLDSLACPSAAAGCRKTVAEVKGLVDQTIQEVRSLTSQISPPILYEVGLEAALEWLSDRLLADYGLKVKCRTDQQPKPLSEEMRSTLFQSVRELLLNVVKHAHINEATVLSERINDTITLTIEDLGRGFVMADAGHKRKNGGFGLFNIRQRVEHLGGELLVESEVGRGTRITLRAPLV